MIPSLQIFKCGNCGAVFSEPRLSKPEEDGYRFASCPSCGKDSYWEQAYYCDRCGDPFLYEELIGGHYCKCCFKESFKRKDLIDYIIENTYDVRENIAEILYEIDQGQAVKA